MRNNHVFSILPIGDVAVLGAGLTLDSLTDGQVGFFNAATNLSFVAGGAGAVSDFYIAVAVDRNGDGTLDFIRSAGYKINKMRIESYEGQCGITSLPKILKVADFGNGCCSNDYGIKLHFYNTRIGTNYGFNDLTKTYMVHTDCCGESCCDGCTEAPCADLMKLLVDEINADPDALISAILTDPEDGDAEIDLDDYETWTDANPGICPDLQLTGSFETIKSFCGVNEDYVEPNGLNFSVSQIGWSCPITITTVQELTYEQTGGYDAAWDEYMAGGWNGRPGPYRQYESGTYKQPNSGMIDPSKLYSSIHLTYDDVHASGFQTFIDTLNTTLLIECTDGVDVTFIAVLDALAASSGKAALATALATCCAD